VVLLIATANVGTLLLLRTAKRRRDVAVRIALGASHARLARQALVESVLLALLGAVVGLILARWFSGIVRVTLLPNLAPTDRVIDGTVLIVSVVAATGAGLLAGMSPLAQLGRRDLSAELRTGGHGASGRFVFQNALVALQVALCTLLLVGAGLFVHSLQRVQSQDLGFSTAHLLYVTLDFRGQVSGLDRDFVHAEAAHRLETLPGVTGVTVVEGMPFSSHHIPPISVPGVPSFLSSGVQPPIMYGATPSYLEMMDVTLRQGRLITASDRRGTPLVVLVNETMARSLWPGQRAVGKCVRAGYASSFDSDPETMADAAPCREVVGVVRDSRARSLRIERNEAKLMQYYVPFAQIPVPPVPDFAVVHGILIRTADPARLASSVQRAIQSTATLPVYARVRPYQDLIDPQLRSWRLGATLFSAFGVLALGIAAVGLFGVVSYLVTQRTQEIGVRLALGGTGLTVGRLVVWDAVRMAAIGAGAGLVLAMAGAPLVQSMLFQTSAREPVSAIGAALVLLLVAIAAAAVPAWRASQVSPMTALRTDA
jgi:predicted permease